MAQQSLFQEQDLELWVNPLNYFWDFNYSDMLKKEKWKTNEVTQHIYLSKQIQKESWFNLMVSSMDHKKSLKTFYYLMFFFICQALHWLFHVQIYFYKFEFILQYNQQCKAVY